MSEGRRPATFRLEPEKAAPAEPAPRPPRVADPAIVEEAEIDVFEMAEQADDLPPPAEPARRRNPLLSIFLWAAGLLVTMALGLWTDSLIRSLFSRADWLGWTAAAVAAVAALALVALVLREASALARLGSVDRLRQRGAEAIAANDAAAARAVAGELDRFLSHRPETAAGRRALRDLEGEVIDGADLVRLAEAELLVPLDAVARKLILDAAKRVSLVTAVSPRAVVDLAYVAFEASRLIRRLAELYGARPGTLGFLRLLRKVVAHLAVTGALAAGDEFVHQIVGQGLAARLSAKLGEGVVNGMMTARIGVAAMETVRPLPFAVVRRPRLADFLSVLVEFTRKGGRN